MKITIEEVTMHLNYIEFTNPAKNSKKARLTEMWSKKLFEGYVLEKRLPQKQKQILTY